MLGSGVTVTPGRVARHQEQRDAVLAAAGGAERRDQDVGDVRVGDEQLLPGEPEAVAAPCARAPRCRPASSRSLSSSSASVPIASPAASRGSHAFFCAPLPPCTIASVASTAEEKNGPGTTRAAELLEQQRQVEHRQPGAAVRLGNDQAGPAELRHLPVERAREAVLVARHLAHEARRALAGEELARRSAAGAPGLR